MMPFMNIREDGVLYLTRFFLTPYTRWGQLMLHRFAQGDYDRHTHDHPFDFWTFPFSSYWEVVREDWGIEYHRVVRSFRLHHRPAEFSHRVVSRVDVGVGIPHDGEPIVPLNQRKAPFWTLVWRGPRRRQWGFWTDEGWVHHEAYQEVAT